MLDLYAQCLHHSERNEDYVRTGLRILAKTIRSNTAIPQQPQTDSVKPEKFRRPPQSGTGVLSNILSASKLLKEQLPLPMDIYFDRIDVGTYVRHSHDDDGFQFPLMLRSLLPESFLAESVRVQIVSVEEDQRSELWLHANGQKIEPGTSRIWLRSNVSRLCSTPSVTGAHNAYRRCFHLGMSQIRSQSFREISSLFTVFLHHPAAPPSQDPDTRLYPISPIDDVCCSGPSAEASKFACLIQQKSISSDQSQLS